MRLGCCLNMLGSKKDPLGLSYIPVLAAAGYDYAELPLAQIMELSEQAFHQLLKELARWKLSCECMNNFFPAHIRLTGETANHEEAVSYMSRAFDRAQELGAKIIVFGSSGAKNIPEGFPKEKALRQIGQLFIAADELARKNELMIAIEPLNRKESNFINNLKEGHELMNAGQYTNIRLLVDYYHFAEEKESLQELPLFLPAVIHVHIARPGCRSFPKESDEQTVQFLQLLRQCGYSGRISMEAYSAEAARDLAEAAFIKEF